MDDTRRIRVKAVALGALTDICGSVVVGSVLGLVTGIVLVARGVPPNELSAHLEGPAVLVPGLIIGFGFTVLGGFVAGRVSKHREVMHGGLVGLVGLIWGLLFWGAGPLWYQLISVVGIIPFGMLGGRLAGAARREPTMAPSRSG
jgi:hypothetical protein